MYHKKNACSCLVKYTEYVKVLLIFLDLLSTSCYVTNMSVTKVRDVFPVTILPVIKEYIVSVVNELRMSTEHGWNGDKGTAKYSGKTCSSATLSATNPTCTSLWLSPCSHGKSPTTKCGSHSIALRVLQALRYLLNNLHTKSYGTAKEALVYSHVWGQNCWE